MLNIKAHLDDEIDKQPHVVQHDCKAEVEQTDSEVLDCFVTVLNTPVSTVAADDRLSVLLLGFGLGLHVFVRRECDSFLVVFCRWEEYEIRSSSLPSPTPANRPVDAVVTFYFNFLGHPFDFTLHPLVLRRWDYIPHISVLKSAHGIDRTELRISIDHRDIHMLA